jgi:hypothetical protein
LGSHCSQSTVGFLATSGFQHHNICLASIFVDAAADWKLV